MTLRWKHWPNCRADSDWVVSGAKAGQPLSAGTLEHSFQRIRNERTYENARLHDLRHTVGTYAAQTGGNAYIIRDMLGHNRRPSLIVMLHGRQIRKVSSAIKLAIASRLRCLAKVARLYA